MYIVLGFETKISSEKIYTEKRESLYLILGIEVDKMFCNVIILRYICFLSDLSANVKSETVKYLKK